MHNDYKANILKAKITFSKISEDYRIDKYFLILIFTKKLSFFLHQFAQILFLINMNN